MKINALAIPVGALLVAAPAGAQQSVTFARIDCATSRLVLPPNLICLASNEMAGGDFAGAWSTGYRWGTFGLLCDPAGKTLAANELSSFVQNMGFR